MLKIQATNIPSVIQNRHKIYEKVRSMNYKIIQNV